MDRHIEQCQGTIIYTAIKYKMQFAQTGREVLNSVYFKWQFLLKLLILYINLPGSLNWAHCECCVKETEHIISQIEWAVFFF